MRRKKKNTLLVLSIVFQNDIQVGIKTIFIYKVILFAILKVFLLSDGYKNVKLIC